MQNERFAHLLRLFGSHSAVAHAAGADTGWVHRWPPRRGISTKHALNLIGAARHQGLPMDQVIWALDLPTCSCCGAYLDADIRRTISNHEEVAENA